MGLLNSCLPLNRSDKNGHKTAWQTSHRSARGGWRAWETTKQHDTKMEVLSQPSAPRHKPVIYFCAAIFSLFTYYLSIKFQNSFSLSFHSEQRDTRRAASASSAAQRAFDKIQFAASSRPTRGPALIHPRPHKLNSPRGHPSHSAPSGFLAFCYYTSHIDHKMTLQSFFSNSFSSEFNLISVLTYKVLNNPAPSYPKSLVVSRYPNRAPQSWGHCTPRTFPKCFHIQKMKLQV